MTAPAILASAAEILRPPRRIPVADAAARYLHIHRPGGESGLWNPGLAPYMVEPMNRLADRTVEAVIFVGPARSGKTAALVLGWLTYAICCDPGDFLLLNTSEATARDFSKDDRAWASSFSNTQQRWCCCCWMALSAAMRSLRARGGVKYFCLPCLTFSCFSSIYL